MDSAGGSTVIAPCATPVVEAPVGTKAGVNYLRGSIANDHFLAKLEFGLDFWVDDWADAENLNLVGRSHVEDGRVGGRGAAGWGRGVVRVLCGLVSVLEEVGVEVSRNTWDIGFEPSKGRDRNGSCGWGLVVELNG